MNVFFIQREVKALTDLSCEVQFTLGNCVLYSVSDESYEGDSNFWAFSIEKRREHMFASYLSYLVYCADTWFVFRSKKMFRQWIIAISFDKWSKAKICSYLEKTDVGVAHRLSEDQCSLLYSQLHGVICNFAQLCSENEQAKNVACYWYAHGRTVV
jgi:hypothetical protein